MVEEWKETDGPGIREKSQTTFEHYKEALSAYFRKFNKKKIGDIQRKDVVNFLNEQAERYSESSLRSMRTVLRKTLNFAVQNQYIVRPHGWATSNQRQRRSVCRSAVGTISGTLCRAPYVVLASTQS